MSEINKMIKKSYIKRLIDEQMNEFAIVNKSFSVLRDCKVKEIILNDVIDIMLDDYKDECFKQKDLQSLLKLSSDIYNQLLIEIDG